VLFFYWLLLFLIIVVAVAISAFDNIGKDIVFFESSEELDEMCWQGLRRGPQ
jgi:hypothetical protein